MKRTEVIVPFIYQLPVYNYPILILSESLNRFLNEFFTDDHSGIKNFKYFHQLTKLAHREQTALNIHLDDIAEFDNELADAIIGNARRYTILASDVVFELLPKFVQHDVVAKDALDVFIEHRRMIEQRGRNPNDTNNKPAQNKFPPELMRR